MIRLSVIIPCFNEEHRIFGTYRKLIRFFEGGPYKVEYVFVDDGSTDNTELSLKLLAQKNPAVTYISYPQNRGKGYAVRQGLLYSHHYTKVILDADLSIPPEEIQSVDFRGRWTVIKGQRIFIGFPIVRRVLSFGWHQLVKHYMGVDCDTQAPFTVLRLPRTMYRHLECDGFAYDVEILYKALKRRHKIIPIPVTYEYQPGSKVTFSKTLRMVKELREIRKKK
jgi:dolichyl-phosphate beta-glucosyltransferase